MICHLGLVAVCLSPLAGNTPLTDLGSGTYQGYEGGLYPGGSNVPPAEHAAAALRAANEIRPLEPGLTADSGKIVVLGIGMSNTCHEFSVFERQEDMNVARNGSVVFVNCGLNAVDCTVISNPNHQYWQIVDGRIAAMGLTKNQVQALWVKSAKVYPPNDFPGHSERMRDNLATAARVFKDRFPNVKLCYFSSRIFGGYGINDLSPEPQAYEEGFAFKWVIQKQIEGDPTLNYDPARGPVEAPVLLWGPYLWADGANPRSDGLVWLPEDFEYDGTHPSALGEQKVADMVSAFFALEPSVRPWYRKWPGIGIAPFSAVADAHVSSAQPDTNFGRHFDLLVQGGTTIQTTYLKFDVRGALRPVIYAKLGLRINGGSNEGIEVRLVPASDWGETTITYANAPPVGAVLRTLPRATQDGTLTCDVTGAVNSDPDGVVSFAVTHPSTMAIYKSKEGNNPPRLTLSVRTP